MRSNLMMMFFLTLLRIFIAPPTLSALMQNGIVARAVKSKSALLIAFPACAESLLKVIPGLRGLTRADRATPIYI